MERIQVQGLRCGMHELQQEAETVAIKACAACGSGLLERDRFCRSCGGRQPDRASLALKRVPEARQRNGLLDVASSYETVELATNPPVMVYRRVSASLVNAVVTGALTGPSRENQGIFARRVILALISIPVWLIIVLLSPLDAYAALKNLARQG
jgi:hypothetical protein